MRAMGSQEEEEGAQAQSSRIQWRKDRCCFVLMRWMTLDVFPELKDMKFLKGGAAEPWIISKSRHMTSSWDIEHRHLIYIRVDEHETNPVFRMVKVQTWTQMTWCSGPKEFCADDKNPCGNVGKKVHLVKYSQHFTFSATTVINNFLLFFPSI